MYNTVQTPGGRFLQIRIVTLWIYGFVFLRQGSTGSGPGLKRPRDGARA